MSFITDDHTIFTKDLRNMVEQVRRKLGSLTTGFLASPNEKRNDGYNVSGFGTISGNWDGCQDHGKLSWVVCIRQPWIYVIDHRAPGGTSTTS